MMGRLFLAGVAALMSALAVPAAPAAAQSTRPTPPNRPISWLNIGDSYGAGEGASQAGGHCQRSPNAAGPKAANILRQERGWNLGLEVFSACTGHITPDVFTPRTELVAANYETYGHKIGLIPEGAELTSTQSLYQWALDQGPKPPPKYDVITLSMSGNDVGFAEILTDCLDLYRFGASVVNAALPSATGLSWEERARQRVVDHVDAEGCNISYDELAGRIDGLLASADGGHRFNLGAKGDTQGHPLESLTQLYREVAAELLAPGGVLVVMGYPRLFTPSSDWGRWRGGQCNLVGAADTDNIGKAAEYYDKRLRETVTGTDPRFRYVSRLELFDNNKNYHSLCGRGTEWINTPTMFLRDGTMRYQRAFHPNDPGYLATAEAVAGQVETSLGTAPPAPLVSASTTTATVRSSEPHWEIGDKFSATCIIAWPTAPQRGRNTIQMRTSCAGVPKQFLFVDIIYDDPDLPVTPSRSRMKVEGTIVEISRNELGFTVLVVEASDIQVL
jgi:hypothetical protein